MQTLGIDLAAQPRDTAACMIEWVSGAAAVIELASGQSDAELLALCRGRDKVGIDAPFGWPDEFVDAVVAHRDGASWPAAPDQNALRQQRLALRETDRRLRAQGFRPLSVSTDKIGVPAMRCAHLLHELGEDDRSGAGTAVEVYPSAALQRWGLASRGYKGDGLRAAAAALLDRIPWLAVCDEDRELCATDDDAFDAVVCALVARAAALGHTDPAPIDAAEQARREGWIHVPHAGTLEQLAAGYAT